MTTNCNWSIKVNHIFLQSLLESTISKNLIKGICAYSKVQIQSHTIQSVNFTQISLQAKVLLLVELLLTFLGGEGSTYSKEETDL